MVLLSPSANADGSDLGNGFPSLTISATFSKERSLTYSEPNQAYPNPAAGQSSVDGLNLLELNTEDHHETPEACINPNQHPIRTRHSSHVAGTFVGLLSHRRNHLFE